MYLLVAFILVLVGCSTHAQLPQDHLVRTLTTEERSLFGTNMGFAKAQHCEKQYTDQNKVFYEPVNCTDLTGWVPMWSQGQGGQLVGGIAAGAGAAAGGALVDTGANVTQTVIQSVSGGGKGK